MFLHGQIYRTYIKLFLNTLIKELIVGVLITQGTPEDVIDNEENL